MHHLARWSSGLRLRPLTPATGVRIPHGSPCCRLRPVSAVGVYYVEDPPVPIPNTVVKLNSAEDTWMETSRENRSAPTFRRKLPSGESYSSIAQSVERVTVNHDVVGSSPTWGARCDMLSAMPLTAYCLKGPLAQLVRAAGS